MTLHQVSKAFALAWGVGCAAILVFMLLRALHII
jgi:hypothetical protein